MGKKNPNTYTVRFSVGLTVEQAHRLSQLAQIRARKGEPQSNADLVRDAINYFLAAQEDLPGSKRAIAKGIETKVDTLIEKLDRLTQMVENFIGWATKRSK